MSLSKRTNSNATHIPSTTSRSTRISEELKTSAKGAVKAAVDILSVAASVTQNVPYIGIVSGVLTELSKIQDEVNVLKSDCASVATVARQIKSVVDRIRDQCEVSGEGNELPEGLVEPFQDLEKCIVKTLEVLHACKGDSLRPISRIRLYFNRGELLGNVRQCRLDLQAALDLFNARLHVNNTFAIHLQYKKLEIQDRKLDALLEQPTVAFSMHTSSSFDARLPPSPSIFHGRAREVDHIVDIVCHKAPSRVAILGPGGIGKTSIALSVLYHADVEALYAKHRLFLSCEAISNAESLVQELLRLFGLVYLDRSQGSGSPLDMLLLYLQTLPSGIICLDNLETPWDADTLVVENILARIASLPRIALIITTRGANRPRGVSWTQPFLSQIEPLTSEGALAIWDAICEFHDDYSLKLVQAVDCVPLAVTILSHLAESESSRALWTRWEREQTELLRVHGPEHRLSNVDISIRMSLDSPRLRDDLETLEFFSVLCTLPQGMLESRVETFSEAFADILPNSRRSITLLKRCSLAYTSKDGYLRVLSPVRHYMQTYHRISGSLFSCVSVIYCTLVDCEFSDFSARLSFAKDNLQPELANISTILRLSLKHEPQRLKSTLRAIQHFSRLSQILFVFDITLLSEAIVFAHERGLAASEANLLLEKGRIHFFQFQRDEALPALADARCLFQRLEDRQGEAESLQTTGDVLRLLDRLHEAIDVFQRAFDLFVEVGYQRGQASTFTRIGELQVRLGSFDDAERSLRSALQLYGRETGVRLGEANAMRHLGGLYARLGRVDEAEHALRSALRLYNQIGARLGKANTWLILAKWYSQLGRYEEAESAAHCAMEIYTEFGGSLGEANVSNCLGRLYTQLNRLDEAVRILRTALALYQALGNQLEEVNVMNLLGFVYRRLGLYEDARAVLNSSSDICQEKGFVLALGTTHRYLGLVHRDCARLVEAKTCFEEALRCYEVGNHAESVERALQDLVILESIQRAGAAEMREMVVTLSDPETASIRARR
ncbi:TPR-like protein [Peniophora sp. CONT]|nr:TPR-like protein [Peniophora sp. CONT]